MTRIIGIVSGKGGTGKTTVAINLACALGMMDRKTALIDFNFTTSHLAMELGMLPRITLNNVLRGEAELHEALYERFNTHIIPASIPLSDLQGVELSNLKTKIKGLLSDFEIVLLDSAAGFGREALATIQTSDELIFVANPTMVSVTDIIKCKELALKLGGIPLGLVVNRYRGRDFELKPEEIARLTELPPMAVIRDEDDFLESEAAKTPLIFYKRHKADEFLRLASYVIGYDYKKPSLLERILIRLSLVQPPKNFTRRLI